MCALTHQRIPTSVDIATLPLGADLTEIVGEALTIMNNDHKAWLVDRCVRFGLAATAHQDGRDNAPPDHELACNADQERKYNAVIRKST